MDFIWILVGMPIVCGLYSICLVLRDRFRENGRKSIARASASPPGASGATYSSKVWATVLNKGKVKPVKQTIGTPSEDDAKY